MRGRQEDREADPAKTGSTENNFRDLARLAFFRGANSTALAAAAPRTRWIFAGTGELLLDFGDATNDVFLVVRGAVRIVVRTPLGQELILNDLGAGEIFGEMAAIDGAPRSASATALNTTSLCRLPAATFLDVVLRSPEVGLRLLRILTARLRLQGERSSELALLPARLRLAAELLRLSRPRSSGHSDAYSARHYPSIYWVPVSAFAASMSRGSWAS